MSFISYRNHASYFYKRIFNLIKQQTKQPFKQLLSTPQAYLTKVFNDSKKYWNTPNFGIKRRHKPKSQINPLKTSMRNHNKHLSFNPQGIRKPQRASLSFLLLWQKTLFISGSVTESTNRTVSRETQKNGLLNHNSENPDGFRKRYFL